MLFDMSQALIVFALFLHFQLFKVDQIIDVWWYAVSVLSCETLKIYHVAIICSHNSPLIRKKKAPVSFATALAMSVLPVPGGPYNKIPLGGWNPKTDICKWQLLSLASWNSVMEIFTLVLLNLDCKQCKSTSVGFWRSQQIWVCTLCH